MRYLSTLLVLLLLTLGVAGVASADPAGSGPLSPQSQWQASYWNNKTLSGPPILIRQEEKVDYQWWGASPHPSVNSDRFSARWTRRVEFAAGAYRFFTNSDDGVRIWVNDELVVDRWYNHGTHTYTGDIFLAAGVYEVRMDYYENVGAAAARISWQPIDRALARVPARPAVAAPAVAQSAPAVESQAVTAPAQTLPQVQAEPAPVVAIPAPVTQPVDNPAPPGEGPVVIAMGPQPPSIPWPGVSGGDMMRTTPVNPPASWRGEYFANPDLSGAPALVRTDGAINFNWGDGSPDGAIPTDHFSVRWTQDMSFSLGRYRFTTTSDDGVRLFVDGVLLINKWETLSGKSLSGEKRLDAGSHTVRLEYYEHRGSASIQLKIERLDTLEPIGNIITCASQNPPNYSWIRVYRRQGSEWARWGNKGIGSIHPSGFIKIDGLPVSREYGDGHPYWIERYENGSLVMSTGNTDRGEPEFRVYAYMDNFTPWQCPR